MIALSPVAGIKPLPNQAHCRAAKHGVTGVVKSVTIEPGELGIRVNSVPVACSETDVVQGLDRRPRIGETPDTPGHSEVRWRGQPIRPTSPMLSSGWLRTSTGQSPAPSCVDLGCFQNLERYEPLVVVVYGTATVISQRLENALIDPNPDCDGSDEMQYGMNSFAWIPRGVSPPPAYPPI